MPTSNCIRHVEEWGAVAVQPGTADDPLDGTHKDTNTIAINQALAEMQNNNGGELRFGPGVYVTNGAVGFEMSTDTNVGITIRGCGYFPTRIASVNMAEPCVRFHTTGGNIRGVIMENLTLRGGLHNLSLHRAAYNRFHNILFWGGRNNFEGELVSTAWGVHSYLGQQNQFNNCWFYETGAHNTDSALFLSSTNESLNNCTYGENGGGIVQRAGLITINGGTGYGAWYRGNNANKWLGLPLPNLEDGDLKIEAEDAAFFTSLGGTTIINGLQLSPPEIFATLRSAYIFQMNNCHIRSGSSPSAPIGSGRFKGFFNVIANNENRLALLLNGNTFHVRGNAQEGDTGYIIREDNTLDDGSREFKECIVANNILIANSNATMISLADSAPSLFYTENANIVSNTRKEL